MVNRVTDLFTGTAGTNLSAHTGDSGNTWTRSAGFSTPVDPVIAATGGRVRANDAGGIVLFSSGIAVADGENVTVVADTLTSGGSYGVLVRGNVGAGAGYMAYFTGTQVSILRLYQSGGTASFATIASAVSLAPSVANGHTLKITATGTGSSVVVSVDFDGSTVITGTDTGATAAGAALSSFGLAGVYFDTTKTDTTGTHFTSISFDDPGAAATALTFVTPESGRIFQRTGTTGTITSSGTYTGSPASIEARLVLDGTSTALTGFDWSTKVATPSGGVFSFNFASVPHNAWYNVQIRDSATPATIVTSGKVGVGALVPLMGQSNAWLWFARGDSTLTPNAKLRVIGSGSDNGIASSNAAKMWAIPATASMNGAIAFGNRLVTQLNTLVAVIDVTWDGSGLTVTGNGGQWIPLAAAGMPYARAKTFLNTITTKVEAAVIVNGETDGAQSVSQATFYAGMGTLITAIRADFGTAGTPIITPLLGKRTDGVINDAQAETIRNAQVQKAGDTAIYRVERTDLTRNADGIHLDPTGFTNLGIRCAQALSYALGSASYYRGPRLGSVLQTSPTAYVGTLTHDGGTDFTPTSGITGLAAYDGATPVTISSVARASANTIAITLATAPAALPSFKIMYGTSPVVTAPLLDNSALALPLEFNDGVTSTAAGALNPRTVTATLGDALGALPSLTGLMIAIYDEATPDLHTTARYQTASGTTNGAGVVSVTFNSALAVGGMCSVVVRHPDGRNFNGSFAVT